MISYETDVLIVGGGGAATAAAISAHESGARTMMVVKGRFGKPGVRGAGATSNPIADFWTIRTVGRKGGLFNPPELVHQDMVQAGLGMADSSLCQIFVDEVPEAIDRLRKLGLEFQSKMLAVIPAVSKSGGTNNIVAIQKAAIDGINAQVLEEANLTDLLVEDGRCYGAIGISDAGERFVIRAGAVVLATGGVGQLFKYSFNPPGNTGDGYAMALRAGAELFNMEFMQQGLATTWPCQAMIMLYEMPEPYRMFNGNGKSFIQDYLPESVTLQEISECKAKHWPVSSRDKSIHLDRAIHGEAIAGRGTINNGIYLDLSSARRGFLPEMFVEYMEGLKIDLKNDLLQIQNHHHTSNGGVRVNEHCESSIKGLFAAGESMGYQGADRLGGTMLGGSQVFGFRAGRKAAEVARERIDTEIKSNKISELFEPLDRMIALKGTIPPSTLLGPLQYEMWAELLVEKDEDGLLRALTFVQEDRERLMNKISISSAADQIAALEHRNLLDVAEAIIGAASMRKESRGSHYRSDYPGRDDVNWLTNIIISKKKDTLSFDKKWVNDSWIDQSNDLRILPWG